MSENNQITGSEASGSIQPIPSYLIWNIQDLTRETSTGVVKEVEWALDFINERVLNRKKGVAYLTGSLSDPNFIEFNNLTEDIVLSWITGSLDQTSLKTELSSSMVDLLRSKDIDKTPW
jgi:hypothetical protein